MIEMKYSREDLMDAEEHDIDKEVITLYVKKIK